MKVLVIGNGGREHALAWKIAQSPKVTRVFVAPGNGGTANEHKTQNVPIAATDISNLLQFALDEQIDLTIVGPEAPLALGIVDAFQTRNIACLGPTRAAAQLESSKAYSKSFMEKYGIPTAQYQTFDNIHTAQTYLQQQTFPIVLKADGLAAGKGVIIAQSITEANQALEDLMVKNRYGNAGSSVVIEEFLHGEEASFIILTDGKTILPMASSQDHKRRDDNDQGPNTGGMGAYSPAPIIDATMQQTIIETIIEPTLKGLEDQGLRYCGFLYAGLMIDRHHQPKVLEYNCRFGDPETQPIMMRLESDLFDICQSAVQGSLSRQKINWSNDHAIGVVLASQGYPEEYSCGHIIHGLRQQRTPQCKIFHAGTKSSGEDIVNDGGRVLCVTAINSKLSEAKRIAYDTCKQIHWDGGVHYRRDIAYRAMTDEQSS